jgi:hypothetical protein
METLLPGVRCSKASDATRWAVFDVSFVSPPHFDLVERHLYSGDIALRLAARQEGLILRQVYPATTALARRPIARWLRASPFKEHRRLRGKTPPQKWTVHRGGYALAGVKSHGRKKLAFPLGWAAPRYHVAAAVAEEALDRLLIADHSSARDLGDRVVRKALQDMNWAKHKQEVTRVA